MSAVFRFKSLFLCRLVFGVAGEFICGRSQAAGTSARFWADSRALGGVSNTFTRYRNPLPSSTALTWIFSKFQDKGWYLLQINRMDEAEALAYDV
ncbi:hypothetical protein PHYPO_G00038540 [Pangasianodon hypophthalmus]|uniref:Secreted protein n=1 Tax=Pangasianodon hypophthalmus TaxID=310915 RepID=A0A5N5MLC3_PANHP|nr:hypothetical protein PHYPO_G00038540 [Pangasianodon hypophthalmus]